MKDFPARIQYANGYRRRQRREAKSGRPIRQPEDIKSYPFRVIRKADGTLEWEDMEHLTPVNNPPRK